MQEEVNFFLDTLTKYDIFTKTGSCLDVGCGGGEFTFELAKHFEIVHGIDKSEEAIVEATARCSNAEITNAFFLRIDSTELDKFGDAKFDVIVARKTLHFIEDIPTFLCDIKHFLSRGGVFVQISSPLFSLSLRNDVQISRVLDAELKEFCEFQFKNELQEYWKEFVKENFVRYCDPARNVEKAGFDSVETSKYDIESDIHILDLREHLKKIVIIKNFIQNQGMEKFEEICEDLLKKICLLIDVEFDDLFFEDIRIQRKDMFYLEVYSID